MSILLSGGRFCEALAMASDSKFSQVAHVSSPRVGVARIAFKATSEQEGKKTALARTGVSKLFQSPDILPTSHCEIRKHHEAIEESMYTAACFFFCAGN